MTRRRSASLLSVIVLTGLAVIVVPAAPASAQVNEVTNWNRIATETLVLIPGPASGAPPALQINMGMTQGAVYDAVNAITPNASSAVSPEEALLGDSLAGGGRRDRGVSRSLQHRRHGARQHHVPEQGGLAGVARRALRRVAGGDTGLAVQDAGDRRGERRRRRDDRRTARTTDASGRRSGCRTRILGTGSRCCRTGRRRSTRPRGSGA